MNSLIINPYQCSLNSRIDNKRVEGESSHLILNDTIFPLYSKLSLPYENGTIDSKKLIRVYMDGDKQVHVVEGKVDSQNVDIKISYEKRILNIRDIGLRLLLTYASDCLYNRKPYDFTSTDNLGKRQCDFSIDGHFNYSESLEMIGDLYSLINSLISSGIMLKSKIDKRQAICSLFGIFSYPWMGPHPASTSEIGSFKLAIKEIEKYKLLLTFELN